MSEASKQNLKVSREGIVLIKSFEGFRPRAERRDPDGWIIGYGHTLSAREGASVSEADAELLLQYDLIPVTRAVNDGVGGAVNQHQFDALASFAFSVGVERFNASDVLQRLKAGSAGEAADALIGWPEPILPSTALRRRAAERALFVADPANPVALADLLSAPLPPPAVVRLFASEPIVTESVLDPDRNEDSEPAPSAGPVDQTPEAIDTVWEDVAPITPEARPLHDVTSESVTEPGAVIETPVDPERPVATEESHAEPAPEDVVEPDTPAALPSFSVVAQTAMQQRYSPYAAPIVGPLPGRRIAETFRPDAVLVAPAFDSPDEQTPSKAAEPTLVADAEPVEATLRIVADSPVEPVEEPIDYSPVQTPVFDTPFAETPTFEQTPVAEPVEPLFLTTATPAQSDTTAGLVLTPSGDEAVFSTPRLVWPHHDAADVDQAALFEYDGSLLRSARPIVRLDSGLDEPARFQWGETGAYVIMGGFGLVSFGMSMAAFRLASQQQSGTDETTIIAWVLAIIGAACVGVSAYNLYRRIGRADD